MPTLSLYRLRKDFWILWDVGRREQIAWADNPEYLEAVAYLEFPNHVVIKQRVYGEST